MMVRLLATSLIAVALASACSPGTGGASGEAESAGSTPPPESADGSEITGAAYRFTLPADPPYVLYDEYVRAEDGQHGRRWRWSPNGEAPYCYLHVVEQPNYDVEFPHSAITLFESGKSPEDTILRNEVLDPPPAGASAAVAQELSSSITLADDTTVPIRGIVREQLTPGRTLLQFIASAPEELVQTCRIAQIADSFVPTGREAPTNPATPSPIASPISSPAPPPATDST